MPLSTDDEFAWGYGELADGVHMAFEVAAPEELRSNRLNGTLKVWYDLPEQLTRIIRGRS